MTSPRRKRFQAPPPTFDPEPFLEIEEVLSRYRELVALADQGRERDLGKRGEGEHDAFDQELEERRAAIAEALGPEYTQGRGGDRRLHSGSEPATAERRAISIRRAG